jgi:hypothetical protein
MLHGLPPEAHRGLLLSVGQRGGTRPFSPAEVAGALRDAISAGTSTNELAAVLHLDGPSMITRFVRLLDLPPGVLHLVDWGQTDATIAFTAASELSRLKSTKEQLDLTEAALQSKLTSTEVKAIVQLRKRSRKPLPDCIKEIVCLRSEVITRHVIIGAITLPDLSQRLRLMHQVERDMLMNLALASLFPDLSRIAGRLGHDRFTISVEDEAAARSVTALEGGLELALSATVETALNGQSAQ